MTLQQLIERLERQIATETAYGSTAPVSRVLESVLKDVRSLELNGGNTGEQSDLIKAPEAARLLGHGVRWVYSHSDELGGLKFAGGEVRFSRQKLGQYIEKLSNPSQGA